VSERETEKWKLCGGGKREEKSGVCERGIECVIERDMKIVSS